MFYGCEEICNNVYEWTAEDGDVMSSSNAKSSVVSRNISQVFVRHLKYNLS